VVQSAPLSVIANALRIAVRLKGILG